MPRPRHRLRHDLTLIRWGKIRVAVDEPPHAVDAAVDVGDADRHRLTTPFVHGHLTALETDRVRQVAALEGHALLLAQPPALEAAADPAEGLRELLVALLD